MNYDQYLLNKGEGDEKLWQEWSEILEWLIAESESYSDLVEWKKHQENFKTKRMPIDKACLHIMTMHSSKGLEYDTVIILDVNEGNIPKIRQGTKLNEKELEEERRIFYVAMTRDRKSVV